MTKSSMVGRYHSEMVKRYQWCDAVNSGFDPNRTLNYRFAKNQTGRLPELADELVRRQVAVIFTFASGVSAAKVATTTIPIVFVLADDPVRLGFVTNIARPGGNLTGINFLNAELGGKQLIFCGSSYQRLLALFCSAHRLVFLPMPL